MDEPGTVGPALKSTMAYEAKRGPPWNQTRTNTRSGHPINCYPGCYSVTEYEDVHVRRRGSYRSDPGSVRGSYLGERASRTGSYGGVFGDR